MPIFKYKVNIRQMLFSRNNASVRYLCLAVSCQPIPSFHAIRIELALCKISGTCHKYTSLWPTTHYIILIHFPQHLVYVYKSQNRKGREILPSLHITSINGQSSVT